MNWDKKVVSFQHERGINAIQLGPAEAIAANRQARIIARWQRDQLRTDEAIERVSKAMEDAHGSGIAEAKEVITALLGED